MKHESRLTMEVNMSMIIGPNFDGNRLDVSGNSQASGHCSFVDQDGQNRMISNVIDGHFSNDPDDLTVAPYNSVPDVKTLEELLREDIQLEHFLLLCGILTPSIKLSQSLYAAAWIWLAVVFGGFFLTFVLYSAGIIELNLSGRIFGFTLYLPIALQWITAFLVLCFLRRRLKQSANSEDLINYQRSVRPCVIFILTSVIFIIISVACLISASGPLAVWFPLSAVFTIPLLSPALLFFLADINSCYKLTEHVYNSVHTLTVKQYMDVKAVVDRKVTTHRWTNGLIVVAAALVNIFALIAIPLASQLVETKLMNSDLRIFIAGLEFCFMKELILLGLIFMACSRVNEKADATVRWLCEVTCVNGLSMHTLFYVDKHPITFTVAGIRVTEFKTIVQSVLFVLAVVAGIIKSELESAVNTEQ